MIQFVLGIIVSTFLTLDNNPKMPECPQSEVNMVGFETGRVHGTTVRTPHARTHTNS